MKYIFPQHLATMKSEEYYTDIVITPSPKNGFLELFGYIDEYTCDKRITSLANRYRNPKPVDEIWESIKEELISIESFRNDPINYFPSLAGPRTIGVFHKDQKVASRFALEIAEILSLPKIDFPSELNGSVRGVSTLSDTWGEFIKNPRLMFNGAYLRRVDVAFLLDEYAEYLKEAYLGATNMVPMDPNTEESDIIESLKQVLKETYAPPIIESRFEDLS